MDSSYFRSGIPRGVDNFRVNASYPEEPCIDGDDLPYWIYSHICHFWNSIPGIIWGIESDVGNLQT